MLNWLIASQIPRPVEGNYPTQADYMLALGVWTALQNADLNFLAKNPDAQYVSPGAYLNALIVYAQSLLLNKFPVPYAPSNWDPFGAAVSAGITAINYLMALPVNASDPQTVSVYTAWVNGTGQLFGGHPATPAPVTQSSGNNPGTGPASVPAGTIFGGSGPQ